MSAAAFITAFVLAAQVGGAGSRYSNQGDAAGASIAPLSPAGDAGAEGTLLSIDRPTGTNPAAAAAAAPQASAPPVNGARQPAAAGAASAPPANAPNVPPAGEARSPYRSPPPPMSDSSRQAASLKPSAMMKQMLSPPPGSQLTGHPTNLLDVLAGARSRHEQAHRIEAYWDLCASVADYYLGVREQDELRQLQQMLPRAAAAMRQAESEFQVRLDTSRLGAVASQRRLASMIGGSRTGLPLPADLPHCGSYNTRYDEIFAGRPSVEAQELAALLSSRYSELRDAATAVARTKAWINDIAQKDSEGIETLRALELLALRRRAFVQISRDYNRRISRYTELSTPGDIDSTRLVGMLIHASVPPTATRPAAPGGASGRQSRNMLPAPPPTFVLADGWESAAETPPGQMRRDDGVRQTAAESPDADRRERSVLVPSRN